MHEANLSSFSRIPTIRYTNHRNDELAPIRMRITNGEFDFDQLQIENLPIICPNPNAWLRRFANPLRGKPLAFYGHAGSLDFRPPCIPMRAWAFAQWDSKARRWPRTTATLSNSSGALYRNRT